MGQRTKGGMWCERCGPVMGVKNTHKVRNTGSLLGELLLPGPRLWVARSRAMFARTAAAAFIPLG